MKGTKLRMNFTFCNEEEEEAGSSGIRDEYLFRSLFTFRVVLKQQTRIFGRQNLTHIARRKHSF